MKYSLAVRFTLYFESHPAWGGWIEIPAIISGILKTTSHPAWGGWIEIVDAIQLLDLMPVPPRMGWVD